VELGKGVFELSHSVFVEEFRHADHAMRDLAIPD